MWLWILSFLFIALVWGVWWFLDPVDPNVESIFPMWVAIVITAVVVLLLVALVVYRRIRAARAARALEKAIAQQAQEQVLASKPENRAEIQELQRQMLEGIKALKASKLGVGGGNALYSLPWYAIVGPPGAGKTTALRHSGLSFPYLGSGGGVKGVGGTRNCDWWFTNDAILLDTAGRYTTEEEDHDEWMAFLDMLRNYRKRKPLNGVVIAVAVNELIDATEDEIEQVAERVRDRIDEMQENLKMLLPVYVMFTKTDLVAGFVEYFGELKRSERGQPWGATLPLAADKSEPGKVFDSEFDLLVEQLHQRAIKRMAASRGTRQDKEKIYQFPLEFAAIKRNLSDFLAAAFKPAPPPASKKATYIPTPILRGFYFTSGTQEGKPLDRVVGAMGRAFGLRPAEAEEDTDKEKKSYFLKEVFTDIVFPDKDVAGRTADELRRRRFQQLLVAFVSCFLALLLLIPAILSFGHNRDLIKKTKSISDAAASIDWASDRPPAAKIDQLDVLRDHLELLDDYREDGAPLTWRWGSMYQGDKLFVPTLKQYIASLEQGCIYPVKAKLEQQLAKAQGGSDYLGEYNALKAYLLLDDPKHLQDKDYLNWQIGRLTKMWAAILRPKTNLSEEDLLAKLKPHTTYYVQLLARKEIEGQELKRDALVKKTRDILSRVGPHQRYYDQFVTALNYELRKESLPATRDNLVYPPITLKELFADRPDALSKISSSQKQRTGDWKKVDGPYTAEGHKAVVESLKNGYEILEREKWVVPPSAEEKQQGNQIQKALERVRQDYDTRYITEWVEFFRDIEVAVPTNNLEAIEEFTVLATPDWPYWRMLKALRDNTQFDTGKKKSAMGADGGVFDQLKARAQAKISSRLKTDVRHMGLGGKKGERKDPVPEKFKIMVAFGFPAAEKEGEAPPSSPLSEYIGNLEKLKGEMTIIEEGPPSADTAKVTELFQAAVADTEAKLLKLDNTGQMLMRELLLNPLRQSYKAMVHSAGGSASGLWEVVVWPPYRDTIRNRYPFNVAAKRDASFEDALAFLKPKEGILWGFYEANLKGFHRKVKHQFVPNTALGGMPRPAKRYTPFNPNMYNCLERADEITDALFAMGAEGKPKVVFKVNLKTVSPIVSEVIFEVDGVQKIYKNEREYWKTMSWPGEGAPGAAIIVRGAGGLNEEIRREGPWGIYRLFEAGTTTAKQDDDKMFTVKWQMTAPPVVVTMQVKPIRGNHPFPPSFFRGMNCPASIGDRFGG